MKLSFFFPLCLLLTGCATGILPTPNYPSVTADWQFNVRLPTPLNFSSGVITEFSGALASSGPNITGTLRARALSITPCVTADTDIPVTGTIDTAGHLSLTALISGGTATLTTTLNPLVPILTGTFLVTGGACAQPSIDLSAYQIPNLTGTYTGTFTQILPIPSGTADILPTTLTIVESATPDAHGVYALTGTFTTTGNCAITIPITAGSVLGDSVSSNPATNGTFTLPPIPGPIFSASAPPAALHTQLLANLNTPTGCPGFAYTGVLTRP